MNRSTQYCLYFLLVIFIGVSPAISFSQQTPAPPQLQTVLISGATAHLGNGKVIDNSVLVFEKGKLTVVSSASEYRPDPNVNYRRIDASGKHLYPGFIAPNTSLGLTEIDAVRATRDVQEVGLLNPSVRSLIAYNTDSKVTPTVRSNGILMAQIVPRGGRISGQSSVVQLDAWNWEDAAYRADDGIHLRWPRLQRWAAGKWGSNKKYDEEVREVQDFFREAQAYSQKSQAEEINLKFEAMRGLFDGSKNLFIHTNDVKSITAAVLMAKNHGIDPIIVGGRDAWRITDFLKEKNVAIVLRQTHSLPGKRYEDIDQPYKTPLLLHDAGIPFCFSLYGGWEQRNLNFQAGQAVGYGLPYEVAVAALTGETAKILGIEQSAGTLEVGKDATLFISSGDALDMRSCQVEQAFINGREIDLDNKQKALDRKFRKKYRSQK